MAVSREGVGMMPVIRIDEDFMQYVVDNNQMHQRLDRELEIRRANSKSLSGVNAADITGIADLPIMKLFLRKTSTNIKNHE